MSLYLIIFLIFVHWIADFVCQDEQWALNKSTSFTELLKHTLTYTIVLGLFFSPIIREGIILFLIVNFIMHTLIDYFSSKVVSRRFIDNYMGSAIPNFGAFTIIGFDQVLHYVVLFSSLYYFT